MANVYVTVGDVYCCVNKRVIATLKKYANLNAEDYQWAGANEYIALGKIYLARQLCDEMELAYVPGEDEEFEDEGPNPETY